MHLIPVIDLKDGLVVHAKLGQRQHYLPIHSALCPSSELNEVIAAFLSLYDFKIIYLADLNAITATGNNDAVLEKLLQNYPKMTFWIDSGYQAYPEKFLGYSNYQAVLGSECYSDDKLAALKLFEQKFILSLDFSAQQALGSKQLFTNMSLWPEKVIIMTLARVGSGLGVDVEKLKVYQQLAKDKTLIASGGIRHKADVLALKEMQIDYALCASALHAKAICKADFELF